jgi:MFS transporter, DHA1 family, inner membrane transport protein
MNAPNPTQDLPYFQNPKHERNFLLLLAAMQFTHVVDFMILMPMGPLLMKTMSLTPAAFGSMVSAYTFSAGLAGILSAIFLDRFERKKAMLVVYMGFIVGTLLCALAPNAHLLLLARIVCGGFGGVMVALVFALIGDAIPMARRGAAMGLVMTAFSVASIAGVPLGLYLSNHFGWKMPFVALTIGSLGMWFVALRLLPRMRRPALITSALHDFGAILAKPAHWRAFVFTFAMMGSTFMVIPYISSYFVANSNVANNELPWLFFAGGLFTFFTLRWFGAMGDRHGLFRVFAWISLAAVGPVLLLTHFGAWGLYAAIAMTVVFMVLVSGRSAPGMALLTTVVEPRLRGGFMSLNTAVQQIASGAGSFAAGLIIIQSADGRFQRYGVVGWIAAAGILASIWLGNGLKNEA